MNPKKYPAKLLLFGEYTVLHGGSALAMPYAEYAGYWRYLKIGETPTYSLDAFAKYLQSISFPKGHLDSQLFAKDIAKGLVFESTIPTGYGAGSSGSLCAAIWDKYGRGEEDLESLQANFIQMESFFHGKSSGLDPLVSYLNQPILQTDNGLKALESMPIPKQIKVYDSDISRSTAPLVAWYQQEFAQNLTFKQQVLDFLLPQNTKAIEATIAGDSLALKKAFESISAWQYENFKPLIPDAVRLDWKAAKKEGVSFKICGAGGGGFFMYLNSEQY